MKYIFLFSLIYLLGSCNSSNKICEDFYNISVDNCGLLHSRYFFSPDRMPKQAEPDKSYERIEFERKMGFIK